MKAIYDAVDAVEANIKYCTAMLQAHFGIAMGLPGAQQLLNILVAARCNGITDPDEALQHAADFKGEKPETVELWMNRALDKYCGAITWREIFNAFAGEGWEDEDGVSSAEGG